MSKEITKSDLAAFMQSLDRKIGKFEATVIKRLNKSDEKYHSYEKNFSSDLKDIKKTVSMNSKAIEASNVAIASNSENISRNTELIENLAMISKEYFENSDKRMDMIENKIDRIIDSMPEKGYMGKLEEIDARLSAVEFMIKKIASSSKK